MRDHDQPALVLGQEVTQPGDGVGVEVVSGLVEKKRRLRLTRTLARSKENLGQFDAATLTTRKRLKLLIKHPGRKPQIVTDLRRFSVGLVAAERLVALLQAGELRTRLVALRPVGLLHDLLMLCHGALDLIQPARGEHTVAGGLLDIALLGVLREVTDLASPSHRATVGFGLPRQDAHRRRFAGAVAAD